MREAETIYSILTYSYVWTTSNQAAIRFLLDAIQHCHRYPNEVKVSLQSTFMQKANYSVILSLLFCQLLLLKN